MRANPSMPGSCTLSLMYDAVSETPIVSLGMVNWSHTRPGSKQAGGSCDPVWHSFYQGETGQSPEEAGNLRPRAVLKHCREEITGDMKKVNKALHDTQEGDA